MDVGALTGGAPCIFIDGDEPGEECGETSTTRLDHPLYDADESPVCDEHEPPTCSDCGGHIIQGACYC